METDELTGFGYGVVQGVISVSSAPVLDHESSHLVWIGKGLGSGLRSVFLFVYLVGPFSLVLRAPVVLLDFDIENPHGMSSREFIGVYRPCLSLLNPIIGHFAPLEAYSCLLNRMYGTTNVPFQWRMYSALMQLSSVHLEFICENTVYFQDVFFQLHL